MSKTVSNTSAPLWANVLTGTRIRDLRRGQGKLQRDLTAQTGLTVQQLSKIELGKYKKVLNDEILTSLAAALKTTPEYLARGGGARPVGINTPEEEAGAKVVKTRLVTDTSVVIPAELGKAAETGGLSFRTTAALAAIYNAASRHGARHTAVIKPEAWLDFYAEVKVYIEK